MIWGPVTVERERYLRARGIVLRVFVAGEDVTARCQYVDDTPDRAVAVLVRHNARGRCYVGPDGLVAKETIGADIEIRREVLEP